MNRSMLPFGSFEPDAPILSGEQAVEARNVIPGRRGYRSLPSLADMGKNVLDSRALGAFSLKDLSGALHTLAGTETGIYALEGKLWVAKHTGTALSQNRVFAGYGDAVYALFGTSLLKGEISGTVQPFSEVEGAPGALRLGVIRDFLVLGRLSGQGNAIRWSGLDSPDSWPEPGSNEAQAMQSDIQIFPVGGNVQAIVGGMGGSVDGLVFLEEALYRTLYVGPPYIFQFDMLDRRRGTLAPASPVVCEKTCIYLAPDGWYATDGASVRAIGAERIDQWFFDTCDRARIEEVRGVLDAENRVAFWSFPDIACPEGRHNRLLLYNYGVDRWACASVESELLFEDYARGVTLEDLNSYGSLEAVPLSLDSAALKNGSLGISAFDGKHALCRFSGPALEAVLDTAESGGSRILLHGFRPLVDRGNAEAMPLFRDRQMDSHRYGSFSAQTRDGTCPQHLSTVWLRARVRIPAGAQWTHAVGCEALVEAE